MISRHSKLINIMRKTLDFQVDATDCKASQSFEYAGVPRCRYTLHGRIPKCTYLRYNTFNPSISVCEYETKRKK